VCHQLPSLAQVARGSSFKTSCPHGVDFIAWKTNTSFVTIWHRRILLCNQLTCQPLSVRQTDACYVTVDISRYYRWQIITYPNSYTPISRISLRKRIHRRAIWSPCIPPPVEKCLPRCRPAHVTRYNRIIPRVSHSAFARWRQERLGPLSCSILSAGRAKLAQFERRGTVYYSRQSVPVTSLESRAGRPSWRSFNTSSGLRSGRDRLLPDYLVSTVGHWWLVYHMTSEDCCLPDMPFSPYLIRVPLRASVWPERSSSVWIPRDSFHPGEWSLSGNQHSFRFVEVTLLSVFGIADTKTEDWTDGENWKTLLRWKYWTREVSGNGYKKNKFRPRSLRTQWGACRRTICYRPAAIQSVLDSLNSADAPLSIKRTNEQTCVDLAVGQWPHRGSHTVLIMHDLLVSDVHKLLQCYVNLTQWSRKVQCLPVLSFARFLLQ